MTRGRVVLVLVSLALLLALLAGAVLGPVWLSVLCGLVLVAGASGVVGWWLRGLLEGLDSAGLSMEVLGAARPGVPQDCVELRVDARHVDPARVAAVVRGTIRDAATLEAGQQQLDRDRRGPVTTSGAWPGVMLRQPQEPAVLDADMEPLLARPRPALEQDTPRRVDLLVYCNRHSGIPVEQLRAMPHQELERLARRLEAMI